MPPGFAAADFFYIMQILGHFDTMIVLPEDPKQKSTSLPAYLLDTCYEEFGGLDTTVRPETRIFDFGNGLYIATSGYLVVFSHFLVP